MVVSSNKTSVNNNSSPFYNIIINFVKLLKFPVIFILYIFAFYYSGFSLTFPIALLLLLILHVVFAGLCWLEVKYDDFFFDYEKGDRTTINYFFKALQYIIYVGPFASWVFLLASLALVIDFLNRLGFYLDKSDIFKYLSNQYRRILHYVIIFFTISINIIFILYGINLGGLISKTDTHHKTISFDWITYIPVRLLSTTILLFSFITYYIYSGFNQNYILGFGIGLSILFYLTNIIIDNIFGTKNQISGTTFWKMVFCLFLFINIVSPLVFIIVIHELYKYMFTESYVIFLPLVTWFVISIYNFFITVLLFLNKANNSINIQYIVSFIIFLLLGFSSTTLYYSVLLNNNIKVITDG